MTSISDFKEYVLKYQFGYTLDNVSFKCLTSIGVGGTCKLLYIPDDIESLTLCIKYLINNNIEYLIIGSGTNILVDDKEFNMVVISLKNIKRCYVDTEDELYHYIYVEAGLKGVILSKYLLDRNISGAEFLSVIPGVIGGLTYMNAGAYKKSMSDIIHSVTYINDKGKIVKETNVDDNLKFSYRHSKFKENKCVILSVILRLSKNNLDIIKSKELINTYISKKKMTQPLNEKNAGSTFKNIEGGYTWELIDKLGFRGYSIGGAMISNKHSNFIINKKDASFDDVINLINQIKEEAKNKYNIDLECEWEIIK